MLLNQYGIIDDLHDIEIAGRTDTSISAAICRKHHTHGIPPEEFLEAYLESLPSMLRTRKGWVCPGVRELLEWGRGQPEVHHALLTGNVRRGAELKLRHYGLFDFFEFGAFGDDSADRNELGPIVLRRARERLKKDFRLESTWVIGDTPHDIACARNLGCRVLAVATGRFSVEVLQTSNPDFTVANLTGYQPVIERMTSTA